VSYPSGIWGSAPAKSNLVHFSRKIWHQVTTAVVTFVGNCFTVFGVIDIVMAYYYTHKFVLRSNTSRLSLVITRPEGHTKGF